MSKVKHSFLDSYDLTISTLSPVHVGCGEDYEPTNYVMQDDCLYHFDLTAAVNVFDERDVAELNNINLERDSLLRLQQFIVKNLMS